MSIYKIRNEFGKHIKWGLYGVAFIFVIGAIFSFGPWQSGGAGQDQGREGVVAKINGEEVTKAEYNALVEQTQEMMQQMGSNSPIDHADMRGYLLQQLIQKRMLIQAARAEGIDLSDRKIEKEYDKKVVEVLNSFRAKALGLTPEQAKKLKTDPRDDKNYKEQLSKLATPRTISMEEDRAKAMVSRDDVLYEVATKELNDYFKSKVKKPTTTDIKNSYDVYKVRQIMIDKNKFPDEQALTQANKIAEEAKKGDFVELAKEYSAMPSSGEVQDMSFESLRGYPADIKEAIQKLKPGQVSRAIKTDMGFFIVKLENKTNTMPANLDKKARNERIKAIEDEQMMALQMDFSKKVDPTKAKVEVFDEELKAYWNLVKANQAFGNKKEYDKLQNLAITSLKKAVKENNANSVAMAKLAQLYQQTGKAAEAEKYLLQILEGDRVVEDASMRIMLGDVLVQNGKKDEALKQYKIASEVAQSDTRLHTQLIDKYKQLGNAEMAAYEENKVKELEAKMKEWQKLQEEEMKKAAPKK